MTEIKIDWEINIQKIIIIWRDGEMESLCLFVMHFYFLRKEYDQSIKIKALVYGVYGWGNKN